MLSAAIIYRVGRSAKEDEELKSTSPLSLFEERGMKKKDRNLSFF
jgi:hypothetical protein